VIDCLGNNTQRLLDAPAPDRADDPELGSASCQREEWCIDATNVATASSFKTAGGAAAAQTMPAVWNTRFA
jgi:hypothetical protein